MNHFKKYSAIFLSAALVLSCTGCQKSQDADNTSGSIVSSGSATVANPIHETTESKLSEETGIGLNAPEGAEEVSYSYIEAVGDSGAIAQVDFTLNGKEYSYRAQETSLTSLFGEESESSVADVNSALEAGQTLSGIYDEFESGARAAITYCDAFCAWTDDESGFVVWLDPVPGILYSVSTSAQASQDDLESTAKACFVSAQGDSDGDESETDVADIAGTYSRGEDSSTVTINEDGTVNVTIERLTNVDGTVTSIDGDQANITVTDAAGSDMGLIFNIDTHELTVTDSTWDLLENGSSFQFD